MENFYWENPPGKNRDFAPLKNIPLMPLIAFTRLSNLSLDFVAIHFFFQIQGALMVASCVQVIVGFTGIMGYILRFIGPLSIAPITALIGLSLFEPAAYDSGLHWGIAVL